MVYGFIKQTGGDIRINSVVDEGTTVRLVLPLNDSDADDVSAFTGQGQVMLLVEDDPAALADTAGVLRMLGFAVLEADGFDAARTILEAGRHIDGLVTDLHLDAGHSGWGLARMCLDRYRDIPVVVVSGRMPDMHPFSRGDEPRVTCLAKPLTAQMLVGVFRENVRISQVPALAGE
jgi:CheY-like chemotaxis protein